MAEKRKSSDDVKKEELDNITTCCICTEAYTDPKALPCIHTFCMKCIQETGLKTNKGPGDEMPCPICRRLFKIPAEGFPGLPRHFIIERLIQVSKIITRSEMSRALCSACLEKSEEQQGKDTPEAYRNCVECKRNLCEECCIEHAKTKLTRNHKVVPIAEYKGEKNVTPTDLTPIICELHRQRVLDVYCADCESVVCAICFIEDHKNHDGSHVDKYVDGFKEEIEINAYAINQFRSTAQTKQAAILKMKEDIRVNVANLECDIASRADELKQLIDKQATTLLQDLRSMQQSNLKEIQLATDDIDAYLSCLETYNSYCQKIIAEGSASDTCRAFSYLSIRAGELYLQCQDLSKTEVQSVNFCFRKSKLEEFLVGSCDNLIGEIEGKSLSLEAKLKQELSANEQRMMLLAQKKQRLLAELRSISDPVLVHTIRPNPGKKQKWFRTEEESNYIIGLAIIDKELFVLCEASPEVEVYDSMKFNICRRWHLRELAGSTDIASCNISKCLYTIEDSMGILRVDPNGKLINKWSTGSRVGCEARLSVTGEANVLLIDSTEHKLSEYSPDGTLIQEINLLSHAGIRHPLHAIKLTNSHFIISHDNYGDLHRVCTVDADGKLKKSFGGKPGSTIGQMHFPIDFSVDGNASVMVLDHGNKRVLLLDSDLEVKREIVTKGHRLQQPWKILLDESNGQLFVVDREWDNQCILVFDLNN